MKYSFHCSNCGHTFFSDDKAVVAEERKNHRMKMLIGKLTRRDFKQCPLVPVGKTGTIARPDLALKLQEESATQ